MSQYELFLEESFPFVKPKIGSPLGNRPPSQFPGGEQGPPVSRRVVLGFGWLGAPPSVWGFGFISGVLGLRSSLQESILDMDR